MATLMATLKKMKLDERKVIITLLFIVLSLPLIRPLGIPLEITPSVQSAYDFIDKLPAGSTVVIGVDASASGWTEVGQATTAMMVHMFKKGIKIIGVSFNELGAPFFDKGINPIAAELGKTYGVDYCNLGYRAGGEASMAGFGKDIHGAFPKDYHGNDIASLPMMQNIKSIKDVAVLISACSSYPGVDEWIAQVTDPNDIPIICNSASGQTTRLGTYVQSGQLAGLLNGLRAGAEYEMLNKQPGYGVAAMDVQSVMHLTIILLVVVGNILYLRSRRQSKGGAAA